jgi:DNA-binding winged helix-turn-helix (wHTH) protein
MSFTRFSGYGVSYMNAGLALKQVTPKQDTSPAARFPSRYVRFGAFQLDLEQQRLFKNGTQVKVQGKVYQALVALLENPGRVVTREELRMHLWPMDTHVNYDANVNTTVNKLRQVLGDTNDQPVFVETIPRRGYSFVAKVEYQDEPMPALDPGDLQARERKISFWKPSHTPTLFGGNRARIWFTAGIIALFIAAMLFGAALTLYSHRAF